MPEVNRPRRRGHDDHGACTRHARCTPRTAKMTNAFARGARIGDYIIEDLLVARAPELAFRARHGILPRVVRLATLDPACTGERAGASRLLREACVLAALHHPGVPGV